MKQTGKNLPHNAEAEEVTLGSMLVEQAAIAVARRIVQNPDDFFLPKNQTICRAIYGLFTGRKPVDYVMVQEELKRAGAWEQVGGGDYIGYLMNSTPGACNVEHYAEIVAKKAQKRRAIALCQKFERLCYEDNSENGELIELFQAEAFRLGRSKTGNVTTFGAAVESAIDHAAKVERGEVSPGLATGFPALDLATGGFKPGQLITLAGETGGGKSTLAQNIAENILDKGGSVLIASVEMKAEQIGKRILASQSRIRGKKIEQAKSIHAEDWTEMHHAAEQVHAWRGEIMDGRVSVEDVIGQVRELDARWGSPPDLVIADYLQLMKPTEGDNRAQKISNIAWGLKQAAMDMGVAVLLVSQLNRAGQGHSEDGGHRRPELWHLKESGDIECHSDAVLLLYNPQIQNVADPQAWKIWLRVAKCRDGMVTPWEGAGAISLTWRPMITRFSSATNTSEQ